MTGFKRRVAFIVPNYRFKRWMPVIILSIQGAGTFSIISPIDSEMPARSSFYELRWFPLLYQAEEISKEGESAGRIETRWLAAEEAVQLTLLHHWGRRQRGAEVRLGPKRSWFARVKKLRVLGRLGSESHGKRRAGIRLVATAWGAAAECDVAT